MFAFISMAYRLEMFDLCLFKSIALKFSFVYFRCEPGLIPNPDTITGCKPECVVDPDCASRDYICENQK